ncbi:MAG: hypothetical protein JNK19_07415 [Tabrizicola sp.]|nr:hypothetical protein [Tabrizicola sp.]
MKKQFISGFAAQVGLGLACALTLTACVGVFAPVKVSDEVIASCVRASGLPDGTQYTVEEVFRTDGMDRRVLPGPDVSPDQVFRINQCIEGRVMGTAPVEAVSAAPATGSACERGGGVFQGGTGYC